MKRLIIASLMFLVQFSAPQAQDSIEKEIEEFVLSPCFLRIATKIYWRDRYNEQMTLDEFLEQYESVIDLDLVEKSIGNSTTYLMNARLSKIDRLFVYRQVLDLLCPRSE